MDDAANAAVVEQTQEVTAEQVGSLAVSLRKVGRVTLSVLIQLLGIVVGLAIGGALIASSGADPIEAYHAVVVGAFGDVYNFSETLVKATPILLAALGVIVAFRCSVWNIGSEGQLRMGALAATTLGIFAVGLPLPKWVLVPLMIAAGFLAGGAWGALAGWLKVRWNVNEIIGTIMLNFIASFFVNYMITHPLREPTGGGVPLTKPIAEAGELPRLFSNVLIGARLHAGIVIALFSALLVYLFLWHTVPGYRIRAVGANPRAALLGGIDIGGSVVVAMLISGGLAGVGGMAEIAGLHYRLIEGFSPNYGATAILVALLGRSHPVGVVIASILFGGLIIGTDAMTRAVEVPGSIVFVLQGLIVLSMLAADLIAKRLKVTE